MTTDNSSFTPSRRLLLAGASLAVGALAIGGLMQFPGTQALAAATVGQQAPVFSVTDTNGVIRDLEALKGKIVVLEWTNADCPFTRKHYDSGNMQSLQREATAAGVIWLSVISSGPGLMGFVDAKDANALTKSRDAAPSGILLDPDGNVGHAYGAQTTPHMYIIGADGTLLYQGGIDSIASTNVSDIPKAEPYFQNAIQAVLKGEAVAKSVTRPYGCNVKYAS